MPSVSINLNTQTDIRGSLQTPNLSKVKIYTMFYMGINMLCFYRDAIMQLIFQIITIQLKNQQIKFLFTPHQKLFFVVSIT